MTTLYVGPVFTKSAMTSPEQGPSRTCRLRRLYSGPELTSMSHPMHTTTNAVLAFRTCRLISPSRHSMNWPKSFLSQQLPCKTHNAPLLYLYRRSRKVNLLELCDDWWQLQFRMYGGKLGSAAVAQQLAVGVWDRGLHNTVCGSRHRVKCTHQFRTSTKQGCQDDDCIPIKPAEAG